MKTINSIHFITGSERETQDLVIEKIKHFIPEFTYIGKQNEETNYGQIPKPFTK